MNDTKLLLVNKLFNDKTIRTVWDKDEEQYYVSVVDVVGTVSESSEPRKYWNWLKNKLKNEEKFETSSITRQLKLKALDGKYRNTDVVTIQGMFRIIESIPSKNAEPIKQWLAKLGSERIDEVFDPSVSIQRSIDMYRTKGFDEKWITERIKGIQTRKELTDVWKDGGITEDKEFAILTNEIYHEWSGMNASEYKSFKGLKKENLRDNMSRIEELLSDLGEEATKELARKHKPKGLKENKRIAKLGGHAAKTARDDLERNLGKTIVTSDNNLKYNHNNE